MKKMLVIVGVMALALSAGTLNVLAASDTEETNVYSYLDGQLRCKNRNDVYAQAEQIEDDDERNAFLVENGIGEVEWSEEAALGFSFVQGSERGGSYRLSDDDNPNTDMSTYNYVGGQIRGSSYRK